jgi:hypothetical protein
MQIILLGAAVVSLVVTRDVRTSIMLVVLTVFNAVLGLRGESKAEASLSALEKMMKNIARVRRDGQAIEIEAEELVPGDIVLMEAGNRVPADGRLFVTATLEIEEAALTGESVASSKDAETIDKGEVLSACGFAWPAISVTNPGWFGEKGTMRVLLQTHVKGHAELNAMGVPNAMSFAKTDEQRAMLELFFAQQVFGRPYVVAPQVPKERVEALRKAFWATLKDPELLADAKRANLEVDPVSADDVQALIAKIYASPREITEKIKKALQPN